MMEATYRQKNESHGLHTKFPDNHFFHIFVSLPRKIMYAALMAPNEIIPFSWTDTATQLGTTQEQHIFTLPTLPSITEDQIYRTKSITVIPIIAIMPSTVLGIFACIWRGVDTSNHWWECLSYCTESPDAYKKHHNQTCSSRFWISVLQTQSAHSYHYWPYIQLYSQLQVIWPSIYTCNVAPHTSNDPSVHVDLE